MLISLSCLCFCIKVNRPAPRNGLPSSLPPTSRPAKPGARSQARSQEERRRRGKRREREKSAFRGPGSLHRPRNLELAVRNGGFRVRSSYDRVRFFLGVAGVRPEGGPTRALRGHGPGCTQCPWNHGPPAFGSTTVLNQRAPVRQL